MVLLHDIVGLMRWLYFPFEVCCAVALHEETVSAQILPSNFGSSYFFHFLFFVSKGETLTQMYVRCLIARIMMGGKLGSEHCKP